MEGGKKKRVLISGAGIAGMACAVLLDKEKYEIELIEQAGQFRNIGFSIVLWKSGFRCLASVLGKQDIRMEEGKDYFRVDGFRLFGDVPLRLMRHFDAAGYGWAFKRQRLMEIMESALRKELPPESVNFSRGIRHIQYRKANGPATVIFRDGTEKEYDIVIIAEGVHSSSRELVAVNGLVVSNPYALRYAWFKSPTELGTFAGLFFTQGQVAVIHPPNFENLLGFYFDKGTSEDEQRKFEARVTQFIRQPDGSKSVLDTATSDVFELKEVHLDSYFTDNLAIVGDAAHGRSPTIGFGTSLALEDATVLCRNLNGLEEPSPEDINRALRAYSVIRIPRVEAVYRVQNHIQMFYTKSRIKIAIGSLLIHSVLGNYFEWRMKALASVEV